MICERLTELMEEKQKNAKTIAREIGVSESTLSDWKNGKSLMKLSSAIKVVNYFNCSLEFLMGRSDEVL